VWKKVLFMARREYGMPRTPVESLAQLLVVQDCENSKEAGIGRYEAENNTLGGPFP
jgi:hypothetical protein